MAAARARQGDSPLASQLACAQGANLLNAASPLGNCCHAAAASAAAGHRLTSWTGKPSINQPRGVVGVCQRLHSVSSSRNSGSGGWRGPPAELQACCSRNRPNLNPSPAAGVVAATGLHSTGAVTPAVAMILKRPPGRVSAEEQGPATPLGVEAHSAARPGRHHRPQANVDMRTTQNPFHSALLTLLRELGSTGKGVALGTAAPKAMAAQERCWKLMNDIAGVDAEFGACWGS